MNIHGLIKEQTSTMITQHTIGAGRANGVTQPCCCIAPIDVGFLTSVGPRLNPLMRPQPGETKGVRSVANAESGDGQEPDVFHHRLGVSRTTIGRLHTF